MATLGDLPRHVKEVVETLPPATQAALLAQLDAQDMAKSNLNNVVFTLRQWAADARNTTVTSQNAVQVLQTTVNRLGVFFDRFADMLVAEGKSDVTGPTQQKM